MLTAINGLLIGVGVGVGVGFWLGWRYAHLAVAEECRRMGGFFVDRTIFKCIEIIQPKCHYPGAPPNPHRKETRHATEH